MTISIVIPTYNEAAHIEKLVRHLLRHKDENVVEIIVTDGGSSDETFKIAGETGAKAVQSPAKGRSVQLNYGASLAKGEVLYFIHADTFPPQTFCKDIATAIKKGFDMGRYTTKFLSRKPILKLNEWFTHLDFFICMGGDQTLFVKRKVFNALNGFKKDMLIMEEYEFCKRARDSDAKYIIMKGAAQVSARKYEKNSWLQVQLANYKIVSMYKKGALPQSMAEQYKRMLKW